MWSGCSLWRRRWWAKLPESSGIASDRGGLGSRELRKRRSHVRSVHYNQPTPFLEDGLLHQRYKDIVFWGIAKATLPNYYLHRFLRRPRPANGGQHLHLGCGPNYLAGFLNIDGNPFQKIDLWLDVRNGLPFPSNFVDSIYSTHMFEHFYSDELKRLLQDCVRVLKPGGGIRLVVPSLASAIAAYSEKRSAWFYDSFPRHFDSLGGRFSNFVFCDGQHRTAFDFGYLDEVLRDAGFHEVEESAEGKSRLYGNKVPPFEPGDSIELPHSLYVEAFK
jgi:SAM-dependent methyltransferase